MKLLKKWFGRTQDKVILENPNSQWSIGIYTGLGIGHMADPGAGINPVLTIKDIPDYQAVSVTTPFMIHHGEQWHMFFGAEVETDAGPKGKIAHALSPDGLNWTYQGMVLEEPFHLSYPYVFEWEGNIYMIPETRAHRSVRLYRAVNFPGEWIFEKSLLTRRRFADNSLFQFQDRWWMFTDSGNHTLRLYYADRPDGKWREHGKSPLVKKNPGTARPGGRVVVVDGHPIRFAQDGVPTYGRRTLAFKIMELTPDTYEEVPMDMDEIGASGRGWNAEGMHTIDLHALPDQGWIACVDGLGFIEE